MIDVAGLGDVHQRRVLKHFQRRVQRAFASALLIDLALEHAGGFEHLVDGGEVAHHIAAIVELRQAAEGGAQQLLDQIAIETRPFGPRADRLAQHVVGARIEGADQCAFLGCPSGQRFEIANVDLERLVVIGRQPSLDRPLPDQGSMCCINGS